MARGEDTSNHPNRKVHRESFMTGPPAGFTMNNLVKGLVGQSDDAPAGGIRRPAMDSCTNCGTQTPAGSGTCADC